LAVIGFVGASQPDDINRSDHNDFHPDEPDAHGADQYIFNSRCAMFSLSTLFISLSAGRIWWIRRDVVTILEPSVTRTYNTVIAMMYDDALSLRMTNSLSVL
jgi:hypothetical protein